MNLDEHLAANRAKLEKRGLKYWRDKAEAAEKDRDDFRNQFQEIADFVARHWQGAGRPWRAKWIVKELIRWTEERENAEARAEAADAENKRLVKKFGDQIHSLIHQRDEAIVNAKAAEKDATKKERERAIWVLRCMAEDITTEDAFLEFLRMIKSGETEADEVRWANEDAHGKLKP